MPKLTKTTRHVFKNVEELDRLRCFMLGLPVKKKAREIPWGYKISETDPTMLEPIDLCFKFLVRAKEFMDSSTYSKMAEWLTHETGVPVSMNGLQRIMDYRQPDDRAALPREERERV